jgi:hypothetical protein
VNNTSPLSSVPSGRIVTSSSNYRTPIISAGYVGLPDS